jgi:hypothetical protein
MSSALAIAATTRVLSSVILQGIQGANVAGVVGASPAVTSRAPDQLEVGTTEAAQLSLLLYRVTLNPGWRQTGLPSRNGAGPEIDRPPLALDLHYLLVAYGDSEYVPQILLGLGMQALHETPVLYRQQIANTFTSPPPLSQLDAALATANLGAQVEMIKVAPEPLTTEDLSKLWTAFGGKFRPSAGYEATVVLIESDAQVKPALPVRVRNLSVSLLHQPSIATVSPLHLPVTTLPLSVTLLGGNLAGDDVTVVFDRVPGAPQDPKPVGQGDGEVTVELPPNLPAGINTLRVVRQVSIGAGPPKNVVESNVSLFYLLPVIKQAPAPPHDDLIEVGTPVNHTIPVTVTIEPAPAPEQKVQLLLNELNPPAGGAPLALTFDADAVPAGGQAVTFTTFGTRAGDYLVRVRVDGAESPLRPDDPTQPYALPKVTL